MRIKKENNQFNAIQFGVGEFQKTHDGETVHTVDALKFLDRNQKIESSFSPGLYERIASSVNDFEKLNLLS